MLVVAYGGNIAQNAYDALVASDIASYLKPGFSVSIKPNLVCSRPACEGATTHPEVVEGILLFLKSFGVSKIKIIESSSIFSNTKQAFRNCGYDALSHKYSVPLVDLKSDGTTAKKYEDSKIEICKEALNTDFLINVPVLKAHSQTRLTCCMKNLKGCIPDREKRRFHSIGLHKPIAALNMLVKTGYCVVDGICGDLSFEEGGTPIIGNRIIVGRDPLLVDSFCAELIGYRADEIGYIAQGEKMGVGRYYAQNTKIVELNVQNKPIWDAKTDCRAANRYRGAIDEDAACSACYSSLIFALHRLGAKAPTDGGKICIGQGFKGKSGPRPDSSPGPSTSLSPNPSLGVGNCCSGFERHIPGCPPKATDILAAFERYGTGQ